MNNNQFYIIQNATHNTYLCVDASTGKEYFTQDKTKAKYHKGEKFTNFVCDNLEEQYPQFNFKVEAIN